MEKKKNKRKKLPELFFALSASAAGAMGLVCAIESVIPEKGNRIVLAFGILAGLLCWIPYGMKRCRRGYAAAAGFLPAGIVFAAMHEKIAWGLRDGILKQIWESMANYVNGNFSWAPQAIPEEEMTAGLLAAAMLFQACLFAAAGSRRFKAAAVCLDFLVFLLPFLTGETVSLEGAAWTGGSVLFLLLAGAKENRKIIVGAAMAAVLLASVFPKQALEPLFSNPQEWRGRVQELLTRKASGGISDGELGTADEVRDTGKQALVITASKKPDRSMYLKGYVGADYQDNTWKNRNRGRDFSEKELDRFWKQEYQSAETGIEKFGGQKLHVEIERKGADSRYRYLPYKAEEIGAFYRDLYAKGSGRYYETDAVLLPETGEMHESPEKAEYAKTDANASYVSFVFSRYMDVPNTIKKRLGGEAGEVYSESVSELSKDTAAALRARASYTKSPGRTPYGEDFILDFMVEKRKGYCVHFASAGVMFFRMNGVPARFVSGYIARPEDFRKQKNGTYRAEIDDSRAHAWPEIYVKELGWIPAEVTPGFRSEGEVVLPAKKQKENGQGENRTVSGNPGKKKEISGTGGAEGPKKHETKGRISIPGAAAAAVILPLIAVWGLFRRKRRWKKIRREKRADRKLLLTYRLMYDLILEARNGEAPQERIEALLPAARELSGMDGEEIQKALESVFETAFGKACPDGGAQKKLEEVCVRIRERIWKQTRPAGKIYMVFWKGF